jgi:hypothetical protein
MGQRKIAEKDQLLKHWLFYSLEGKLFPSKLILSF